MFVKTYCRLIPICLLFMGHAFGQDMRSSAGSQALGKQRFQLTLRERQNSSASAAAKEYAMMRQTPRRLQFLVVNKREVKEGECIFRETIFYRCIRELHKLHYLSPWPLVLPHKARPQGIMAPYSRWVPVEETHQGLKTLIQWQAKAKAGELFDCQGNSCKVIVHGIGNTQERLLAACDILRVEDMVGVPHHCKPIAMFSSDNMNHAWVKAIIGYKYTSRRQDRIRDFYYRIQRKRPADLSLILKACEKALSESDLKLNIRIMNRRALVDKTQSFAGVLGNAERRISPVLSRWREKVGILIEVEKNDLQLHTDSQSDVEFHIAVSTTLRVNYHNTTRENDWHQPTEEQVIVYKMFIKKELEKYLSELCQAPRWQDSETLICH